MMKEDGMENSIDRIIISQEEIKEKVEQIGAIISRDYEGESLLVVCVLKGAALFASDLVRSIAVPVELDFITLSSYGMSAKSSGVITVEKALSTSVEGRNVLIVEDILDTGRTLSHLIQALWEENPKSVSTAILLKKDTPNQMDVNCKYVCFDCPDEFIVGYGLDYAQMYRNLPHIGVLKPEVYED